MNELRGAYVQAWVWVDVEDLKLLPNPADVLPENTTPGSTVGNPGEPVNGAFRDAATAIWAEDGGIEIDEDAGVSRSYGDY